MCLWKGAAEGQRIFNLLLGDVLSDVCVGLGLSRAELERTPGVIWSLVDYTSNQENVMKKSFFCARGHTYRSHECVCTY